MRRIFALLLALALAFSLVACREKKAADPPAPGLESSPQPTLPSDLRGPEETKKVPPGYEPEELDRSIFDEALLSCTVSGDETDLVKIAKDLLTQYAEMTRSRPNWQWGALDAQPMDGNLRIADGYLGEACPNFSFTAGLYLDLTEKQKGWWDAGVELGDPLPETHFRYPGYYCRSLGILVCKNENGDWYIRSFFCGPADALLPFPIGGMGSPTPTAKQLIEAWSLTLPGGYTRSYVIPFTLAENGYSLDEVRSLMAELPAEEREELRIMIGYVLKNESELNGCEFAWSPEDFTPWDHPLVTYARFGSESAGFQWQLISCIKDGEELLTGDIVLSERFTQEELSALPAPEDLPKYKYGDYALAGNAYWDYFSGSPIPPVQSYDLENQPENEVWTDYFTEKLAPYGYDGPLVIAESTSLDHIFGRGFTIVTASNVTHGVDPWAHLRAPANKVPLVYTITAAFAEGEELFLLFEKYAQIPADPESGEALGYGYFPWGDPASTDLGSVMNGLQYDAEGNIAAYTILCADNRGNLIRDVGSLPKFMVCNLENRYSELIQYDSCMIPRYTRYALYEPLKRLAIIE